MSGRRELSIIRVVKANGSWVGRVRGAVVVLEKQAAVNGHVIFWLRRHRGVSETGTARTVREALDAATT